MPKRTATYRCVTIRPYPQMFHQFKAVLDFGTFRRPCKYTKRIIGAGKY